MTNTPNKRITAQMIFDAAWQAFIVERRPPAQEKNEFGEWCCCYLTKNGGKCAVGLCIPDGHPFQKETFSFNGLLGEDERASYPIFDDMFHEGRNMRLRDTMQGYLHDINAQNGEWIYSPERMEQIYRDFAKDNGLTIPGEQPNACSVE